jgi:hypothetical protein
MVAESAPLIGANQLTERTTKVMNTALSAGADPGQPSTDLKPGRRTGRTGSRRARLIGVIAALAMTAGLLTATAAPAGAATSYGPACNYDYVNFNACLTINYAGGGVWNVTVGQDYYMSLARADRDLAYGTGMFAELWADHGGSGDFSLGYVPLVAGSPRSGSNPEGLFADFYGTGMNLNERSNGPDRVYAQITFFDCGNCNGDNSGAWITNRTCVIVGDL